MEEKHIKSFNPTMRLAIDLETELQLEITDVIKKFKSALLGMKTGVFLIASVPSLIDESLHEKIKKNKSAPIVGRYLYKGIIFGFKSNLIELITVPAPMIFLRYPKEVEEINIRKRSELPVCYTVKLN